MSTVDLLKNAKKREYMAFEDKALAILKAKVQENPVMKEKLAKLNIAQGISESSEIIDEADKVVELYKALKKEIQKLPKSDAREQAFINLRRTLEYIDDATPSSKK